MSEKNKITIWITVILLLYISLIILTEKLAHDDDLRKAQLQYEIEKLKLENDTLRNKK